MDLGPVVLRNVDPQKLALKFATLFGFENECMFVSDRALKKNRAQQP
jgi:hypothetical protein